MFRNSDRYAVFEISAYQDERIASITAETIDPHGAVKIVQPSDITWTENNAHNGTLENIVKTALVSFPGADSGSILYCQWSIESESSMFNIDWRYQSKLPVMEANTRDYGDFRSVITAAERFYRKAPLFEKNQFGIAAK